MGVVGGSEDSGTWDPVGADSIVSVAAEGTESPIGDVAAPEGFSLGS